MSYYLVNQSFDKATLYAQTAQQQVYSFTNALNTALYAPPTISVTWNSIAPPVLDDLPEAPSMPNIVVSMPTDTPSTLTLSEPTIEIDDFNETAPELSFGAAPVLSYGATPTVPEIGEVVIPEADAVLLPDTPTYLSLTPVSFAGVDLHEEWLDKLETIPAMDLVEPTPYSYSPDQAYASALLDDLKAKINDRLQGGTGLDPDVEQAIWDRARSRETRLFIAQEDEIVRQAESLGFTLPSGAMNAQMREAQRTYHDKLSTLSRDISIKQAELEQENLKQTIAEGMQLEAKLIDYSYQLERLSFEAAAQYAQNAIQVHNAGVEAYKALLQSYQVYAQAYDTLIKGEMSKVEVYKAQLQGEMTKAQINTALVEQYKASIQAQMSKVEIYKAQVSAAQTLVELERAKIGAASEQVKAYVAQVNAETAKIEAYKAGVQAEATKVEVYKTKAQAFSAKVGAQADRAKAELGRYQALVSAKSAEWDGYKTRVQAESERIRALGIQSGTLLDGYKAAAQAVESKAAMTTKVWETQIKEYEASKQIAIQTAKVNNDAVMATNQARLEAAKVGAQVYAQLTASAYGMINASASVSGSYNNSVSYSYSNDTVTAPSAQTSF